MRSSFSYGEHLSARRHLLTEEIMALFDELDASWQNGTKPSKRHELRCKIATTLEIPNERRQSRQMLHHLMGELRTVISRLIKFDELRLSEGTIVTFHHDDNDKPYRIKRVQKDFLLRLEGHRGPVHPKNVSPT